MVAFFELSCMQYAQRESVSHHPGGGRGDLSGYWSRRIDDEHRLVYRADDKEVTARRQSRPTWLALIPADLALRADDWPVSYSAPITRPPRPESRALRPPRSAQLPPSPTTKAPVSGPRAHADPKHGPTRVSPAAGQADRTHPQPGRAALRGPRPQVAAPGHR